MAYRLLDILFNEHLESLVTEDDMQDFISSQVNNRLLFIHKTRNGFKTKYHVYINFAAHTIHNMKLKLRFIVITMLRVQ